MPASLAQIISIRKGLYSANCALSAAGMIDFEHSRLPLSAVFAERWASATGRGRIPRG
jgi:hypothetical protein